MVITQKSKTNKCWQGCGEKEMPNTVAGNVNWKSLQKTVYRFLKKLNTELSYDPAIPHQVYIQGK